MSAKRFLWDVGLALVAVVVLFVVAAAADSGGDSVGFSPFERRILPWVLFFILSGACGGLGAKKK